MLLDAAEKRALRAGDVRGRQAAARNRRAIRRRDRAAEPASTAPRNARFLIVDEEGVGPAFPFSGEKLSPVLAFYRARDFDAAPCARGPTVASSGRGPFGGPAQPAPDRATRLGLTLPVCRVIVNQVHCFATGGSFDNALPFSLSMGCGSWGGNSFSDNLNWRHFINVTRVVHPLAPEQRARADRGRAVRRVSPALRRVNIAASTFARADRRREPRSDATFAIAPERTRR